MKKLLGLFLLLTLSFQVFSAEFKREEKIDGIQEVSIDGYSKVIIKKGSTEELVFSGNEDIIKDIKVKQRGNFLEIKYPKKSYLSGNEKVIVNITLKDISNLEFKGAGELELSGFKTESLKILLDGSGKITLDDNRFKDLDIDINGNGKVEAKGTTENLKVVIKGVGNLEAYKLEAKQVNVKINGTGSAEVYAEELLSGEINGIGKIIYKGNPKTEKIELNGLGKIKKAE